MNELLILSRATHFGACLALLGVFAVRLLVERPAAENGWPSRGLAAGCLLVAAGSGFLWFWVAAAGMNGSGLMDSLNLQLFQLVLAQTPPGHVWIGRAVAATVLAAVLCIPGGGWRWGVIPGAWFVGSLAWLGHAGAGEGTRRLLMLAADLMHLMAAGIWPASLLPFALLLARLSKAGALSAAYAAARRFSAMSLVAVTILAASGIANACFLVGTFGNLVATAYGRLLMLKILLFATAVTLGALNLLLHKPRLESSPSALSSMARNVWTEVAMATLIVIVVAILGTLPPAAQP